MRWFQKPKANHDAQRVTRARPVVEILESREVPATGFLQGTVFVDANENHLLDAGDTRIAGAQVQLFQGLTQIASTTTGADGTYLFTNLNPGTYRIVQTPPSSYTNSEALPQEAPLFDPTVLTPSTIEVTVPDSSQTQVTFDGEAYYNGGNWAAMYYYLDNARSEDLFGQYSATVSGLASGPVTINTFCVNMGQVLSFGENIFNTTPAPDFTPQPDLSPDNFGRIAYLYNHYGIQTLSRIDAAALQIAIYEIEYDNGNDVLNGYFRLDGTQFAIGTDQALFDAVVAKAQQYLSLSAGKSELAIYLDAIEPAVQLGLQSMIAPGSLNFSIVKVPSNPGIEIEKTTNGPTNCNPIGPDYDNEDAANGAGVPVLIPGTPVTWLYKVKNTGNVPFNFGDIVIVDDNGTATTADDYSTTNGKITFLGVLVGDSDNILEEGEEWLFVAGGIVKDVSTATGSTVSFNFSGNSSVNGTAGNVLTFTSNGVSVHASAFSRDKTTGEWKSAYVGSYPGGLGVTDTSENGSSDTHTVDNSGRDNYLLFEFSQSVVIDAAYLGYVVGDSDVTIWIGSFPDAFNHHQQLTDALLLSLGFTEVNLGSSSERLADFNAGKLAGNVLVIAANTNNKDSYDKFKVETLKFQKTEKGTYENKATVSVKTHPGLTDSDLSHYTNQTKPVPTGSISGYKFYDKDGDGKWEKSGNSSRDSGDDEGGLSGWKIFVDYDSDGVWDSDEPYAITGNDGYYKITGVRAGTWEVVEVQQAGWEQTTPDRIVTLAAGENKTNVLFGNDKVTQKDCNWNWDCLPPKYNDCGNWYSFDCWLPCGDYGYGGYGGGYGGYGWC